MTKKKKPAVEVAEPVAAERPRAGGSYTRDRTTGALTRVPHPKAGAVEPAEAEAPASDPADPAAQGEQQTGTTEQQGATGADQEG